MIIWIGSIFNPFFPIGKLFSDAPVQFFLFEIQQEIIEIQSI